MATHALAALAGLVLSAIAMGLASSAGRGDLHSKLIWQNMLIAKLWKRIALLEAETGPCSAQGGCYCPPDIDEDVGEGYAGWI